MEYYYTDNKNISTKHLIILNDEAHHLKNVLRKQVGDEIFVTDGNRNLYRVKINSIGKNELFCIIEEKQYNTNEPERNIYLYLSLLKSPSRFEFAIEKCVEIGVNEISPIITEHVINKKFNKIERWQSIALAAMKQSQRCYLPLVNTPLSFRDAIKKCKTELCLLADERSTEFITQEFFNNKNNFALFIGPEGGFSEAEIEFAKQVSFNIISLGKRKFRSETASIVGVSYLIQHS